MGPDHERFSRNRFRLPPIPPARQDSTWKSSRFLFKHRSSQELVVLPPLLLPVTDTSGSNPSHERREYIRRSSAPIGKQSDDKPREIHPRPIVDHHHMARTGRPMEVPWMPRIPIRTEPSRDLPFQRANRIIKGPWNALLGVASAEIRTQPSVVPDTDPEQPTVVKPRLHRSFPLLPSPPRAQVPHGCTLSGAPDKCPIPVHLIDPAIAKASRARRLAARRKAAQLKREREVTEEPNSPQVPQETAPVAPTSPFTPAKSGKRNENNRRRLANRASVQKCRNKQKIRCKKLHAERDLLAEENKILKTLRDEINASGILKLKVAAAFTAEEQEFLQNYGGLIAEPAIAGKPPNLLNSAPVRAYYNNGISGSVLSRFGYSLENSAHANEENMQARSTHENGQLSRNQKREVVRNQELPFMRSVARENAIDLRDGFRFHSRALPILPGIRNSPCKGTIAEVRAPKINNMFDNLSIESGDDVRDGIRPLRKSGYIKSGLNRGYHI